MWRICDSNFTIFKAVCKPCVEVPGRARCAEPRPVCPRSRRGIPALAPLGHCQPPPLHAILGLKLRTAYLATSASSERTAGV